MSGCPEDIQLRERVKELQCLYSVADLFQRADYDQLDYLRALPGLLPAGWFYPEITAARVTYRGHSFHSEGYRDTPWKLSASLFAHGRELGSLEVVYLEPRPQQHHGPFLQEERELLDALASHVARALQNKDLEERLARTQRLEALGFLAGGVAHDFNNFVSVISLVAEHALIKNSRGEPVDADLKEIVAVAERSCRLANRLVGFVGSGDEEVQTLSLNTLLTECRAMLGRLLSERIELRLDLEPELHPINLAPTQLDQVLANLAINAREAMSEGGIFEIVTRNLPENRVLLVCQDNGPGIPEEIQRRLFEPFFSTKMEGAGLGLATVESIVRAAGGEIALHSQPGQGTRFEVTFPATPLVDPGPPPPVPPPGATVLLVEREDSARYMCERLLTRMGCQVLSAESGQEALRLAQAAGGVVDLLLTNLHLPDMSGRELAERLPNPVERTLMMSACSQEVMSNLADGYPFLPKPFTSESLRECVGQLLGGFCEGS